MKKQRQPTTEIMVKLTRWMLDRSKEGATSIRMRDAIDYVRSEMKTDVTPATVARIAAGCEMQVDRTARRRRGNRSDAAPPNRVSRALAYALRALYERLGEETPEIVRAIICGTPVANLRVSDAYPKGKAPAGSDRDLFTDIPPNHGSNGKH